MNIHITTRKGGINCDIAETNFQKVLGLMLKYRIKPLFFKFNRESKHDTVMHTFFMLRAIDMIFINEKQEVVDIKTVRPFHPCVMPKKPARYVLEVPKGGGKMFEVGEVVDFDYY